VSAGEQAAADVASEICSGGGAGGGEVFVVVVGVGRLRSRGVELPWPSAAKRMAITAVALTPVAIAAAHDRALELGARHLDTQRTFRVYADPAGHPFCLCAC
jgi:hypothetical protein